MKKFLLILIILLVFFASYELGVRSYAQGVTDMKKVLIIIAHDGFRDEEFIEPAKILEANNIEVVVASSKMGEARGMLGAKIEPDMLIDKVNPAEYNAVIFVGGAGAKEYWNNAIAHKIAKDTVAANKILAAICIAPVTLANAGVLDGKDATVWASEAGQLRSKGANYTGKGIQQDGNIITADGPNSAREFGRAILKLLEK